MFKWVSNTYSVMMLSPLLALFLLAAASTVVSGLVTPAPLSLGRKNNENNAALCMTKDRRQILAQLGTSSVALVAACSSPAYATVTEVSEEAQAGVFKPGQKLSTEDAKKRFILARQDVKYLLDNYPEVSKGGGDAVRRYLGTVGVTSGMYGISKVLKKLQEEADDIVEYTETMEEFNAYLYQAEGAAYQSLFVEHSSAKGTPESLLATAKQDVIKMVKFMDQMGVQLSL